MKNFCSFSLDRNEMFVPLHRERKSGATADEEPPRPTPNARQFRFHAVGNSESQNS